MTKYSLLSRLFAPTSDTNIVFQSALAVVRVVVGIMMIHNGLDKLADIETFAEAYVAYLGLPFPIFLSYMAAFTELLAAPLVAIGLFTRPAASGLFFTMCVAMVHHIKAAGLSLSYLELSAIYASVFLFFTANGAGFFSVDALIANWLDTDTLSARAKQVMRLEKAYQAGVSTPAVDAQETVSKL